MVFLQNQSAGFVGNNPLFWREGGGGYTSRVDEAKQFTLVEARQIVRSTRGSHRWKIWAVKRVLKAAHRVVDIQDIR